MGDFVLLRHNGKVVGTAKYFTAGSATPARSLHGISLTNYAGEGEDLVVVHHVQVFNEHISVLYPYSFGGPEPPPHTLGDMNEMGKHFKAFIAWDNKQCLPHDWGCELQDQPLSTSEKVLERRNKGSRSENCSRDGMADFRTDRAIGEMSLSDTVETARESNTISRAQVGKSSLIGRRFSRLRGKGARFESVFSSSKTGADASMEQPDVPASGIDRHADSDISGEQGFQNVTTNAGEAESVEERPASNNSSLPRLGVVPQEVDIPRPGESVFGVDSANGIRVANGESSQMEYDDEGSLEEDSSSDESVEPEACNKMLPFPQKRVYVYHSRKRGVPVGPRDLRKRRRVLSKRLDNPFLRGALHCCKSLKCFDNIDPIFAFKTYKDVMSMNREDYKSFLISLYDAKEGCFVMAGRRVCARYLQKGFGFSNDLQCSVKGTPSAPAAPTASAMPRVALSRKRDAIINFLQDYAEATGDMMPNAMFVNLPEVRRKDVYEKLRRHFQRHYSSLEPPSLNFFYAVWKSHCKNVRTRRAHGFAKCEVCVFLKNEIADNHKRKAVVRRARVALQEHLNMVKEERRLYSHRQERARNQPKKYMSIVVDGADQKAYGLPHFLESSKSDRGHKLKVKCVGCLQHSSVNKLRLLIMTDEHLTGANHIMEVVHRSLTDYKSEVGRFSRVLYVQVDNCTRENKNRYLLSYFELLVALGVFVEVEVSFLPIGHTHVDIDQTFSAVAHALERINAPTMAELLALLRSCYNERTCVERLNRIANFSGLYEERKAIVRARPVRGFTTFRYFRFTRAIGKTIDEAAFRTQCHVKVQGKDNWEPFSYGTVKGFLTAVPDLRQTPQTETFPPDNVTEVNQCLASLYGRTRINAPRIISALEPLRDEVYTKRLDPMHWDLEESFELNGDFRTDDYEDEAEDSWIEEGQEDRDEQGNSVASEYDLESFVAVKTDAATKSHFWIAMVLEVLDRSTSNQARWIRVLWYSQKSGTGDDFAARYVSCQVYDSKRKTRVPYEDQIEVDSVLVQFPALNSQGYLRANTRSALRQVLGLN